MLTHKFQFLSNLSLRVKLMLIMFCFIVSLGTIQGIYSYIQSSKLLIENESQKDKTELSQINSNINSEFNEIDIITKNLIFRSNVQNILKSDKIHHSPFIDVTNQKVMLDTIDSVIVSYNFRFDSVYIYNTSGMVYGGSVSDSVGEVDSNMLKKDFEQRVIAAKGKLVTGPRINDNLFMMGRVINSQKDFSPLGMLFVVAKTSPFQLYQNTGDTKYLLYNQDRSLIGTKDKDIPEYHAIFSNNGKIVNYQGKPYLMSTTYLPNLGWTLVKLTLKSSLLKSVSVLKETTIIGILMVIGFFFPLSIFISSRITKPIGILSKLMLETITKNFNNRANFNSNDEIGKLSQAYNFMIEEINNLIENEFALKLLNKENELKMLQSQINPHFLYNTLDTINWAARLYGIDEVGKLAESLAKLMRISIQDDGSHYTVKDELEYIKSYITIQKYRYEERLEIVLDVDPDVIECEIPKLILQPLLENAIVHNTELSSEPIKIQLKIHKEDEKWIGIKIEDNGLGIPEERMEELEQGLKIGKLANSHGLINVHRRLLLNYGQDCGLIIKRLDNGTSVQFHFPIETTRSEETCINY